MASYDMEWIIRYVDGMLSDDELGPFETAMQADTRLAADVELYREVKATLAERLPADQVRKALTERLSQLNRQHFRQGVANAAVQPGEHPSVARKMSVLRRLSAIAAAACIIIAAVLLWPGDYSSKLDQIGQTNMIGITERGGQTDTLLQKASILFNQKQFDKALTLLNQAVIADSSSQLALFYRGISAWHTGDLGLARTSLQQVYNNGSVFKYEAAFYMALSYASEKNKTMAIEWLHQIPAAESERLKINELEKILP